MEKKAMMFSSSTRPNRGSRITIIPDSKNLGILEVITVKWWDAHGNWIMVARDGKGRNHTIKNREFKYWTKEMATDADVGTLLLTIPKGKQTKPIDMNDFEKGLSQTSEWIYRNCKFAKTMQVPDPGYPHADSTVSGLSVGQDVPNLSSIRATLTNYEVLKGIRLIPMSSLDNTKAKDLFYAANDIQRARELARKISSSKTIKPLIVVQDKEGLYILEGAHRLAALSELGLTNFPALVVVDLDN
jgi:hypothetical protein